MLSESMKMDNKEKISFYYLLTLTLTKNSSAARVLPSPPSERKQEVWLPGPGVRPTRYAPGPASITGTSFCFPN